MISKASFSNTRLVIMTWAGEAESRPAVDQIMIWGRIIFACELFQGSALPFNLMCQVDGAASEQRKYNRVNFELL